MDMAGKDGQELLNELAEKGYTDGMHIEQLSEIQERIRDDNYIPISLNMETLLLQENKDSYVLKIPKSRLNAALEHAIVVPKKDCLLLDHGRTLVTYLDRQEKTNLYHMDAHGHVVEENPLRLKNEDFGKAFAPFSRQKMQQIERLKPEQADIFPSFNQGQENRTDSSNIYAVVLPGMPEDGEAHLRCAIINKTDTRLSEDGKSVTAYLKRDGESVVMVFNEKEEKIREYSQKNEEVAAVCLKQQGERAGQGMLPEPQKLQGVLKSMPEKMVSGKRTAAKTVK